MQAAFVPDSLRDTLARVFAHADFRAGQREAAEALLLGRDAQVLLPTGGGKSLCYQLPAVVLKQSGRGMTLVISPLIALMKDQVEALVARGVRAAAMHSGQDELVQRAVVGDLLTGKLDILYISPERAALPGFRRMLERVSVGLLAVDEAHCISQWGHDFRPEYLLLGELRRALRCPIIALTATATPAVMEEVAQRLGLVDPVLVRGSFFRENLRFRAREVSKDADRLEALIQALREANIGTPSGGRAIVYCATRKKVETVAVALREHGFRVGHYHAGRTDGARDKAQRAYELKKTPVLVATNAFGMGIDHPDVRLIVHFQTPASLEAYYQEAGRAGRDGAPATCELFFGARDWVTQRMIGRQSGAMQAKKDKLLAAMERYARADACRQAHLCSYFTGQAESLRCGQCDACDESWQAKEITVVAKAPKVPVVAIPQDERQVIVQAVADLRRPVGKKLLAQALRGSQKKALRRFGLIESPHNGALKDYSEASLVAAIDALMTSGALVKKGQKYPTVWLANRAVRQAPSPDRPRRASERSQKSPLWRALDNYRKRTARQLRWKVYMVFSTAVVDQVAQHAPGSLWELEQIRGLGPAKVERFGADILAMVRDNP